MLTRMLVLVSIWMAGLCQIAPAQDGLRFVVPDFAPYTFQKDGEFQGIGIELMAKIMQEAGLPYSVQLVPNYGRALKQVELGEADGFFLASQNAERDALAVFSATVLINRWCWFLPADRSVNPTDPEFKRTALIGTHLNSNTHEWLKTNGYQITPLNRVDLLPKLLLEIKQVDAVFLAELVFLEAAKNGGFPAASYQQIVQEEKPFGIYLGKAYLEKHPGVMEAINAAIAKVKP